MFGYATQKRETVMKLLNKKSASLLLLGTALVTVATAFSGCGNQVYNVTSSTDIIPAPGTFMVPPPVDILLAEDNTGSMMNIRSQVKDLLPNLLNKLDNNGWDYHFATVPLTTKRSISQVIGSKYDSNWGSSWVKPYPGAIEGGDDMLPSDIFSTISGYSQLLTDDDLSTAAAGVESGFNTVRWAVDEGQSGTNFIRSDAMLAIIFLSNGNDTSGVTICERSDHYKAACETLGMSNPSTQSLNCWRDGVSVSCPTSGTGSSSLSDFKTALINVKGDSDKIRAYAAVSNSTTCLGKSAYIGTRYKTVASDFGGKSFDLCTESLTGIFDSLATQITSTKKSYRMRYIFVAQEPNPDTIVLTKYPNGSTANAETIPQDSTNGWTYVGWQDDIYTIDDPVEMSQASGWTIELHGDAKLVGDDSASVTYTPKGMQTTVSR